MPTRWQKTEIRSANMRARAFRDGGSRQVLMSRAVVGGFVLMVCVGLWVARIATVME